MSFFAVDGLTAGYAGKPVLRDVSFSVGRGRVMGVLGANGSGKTTLLKTICGILPHAGCCTLDGTPLEGLSARRMAALCGYIPQRSGISIDIAALDVVLMGCNPRLGLLEQPSAAMKRAALEALDAVGLAGMAHSNYLHLSEGQKQLCILARTLMSESRLLLLDEPESALDFRYRHRMLNLLRQRTAERQGAAVVVLHDPSLALNFCDTLLLLSDGGVAGTLCPADDPTDTAEQMLSRLYGPVSLVRCTARGGQMRTVMLYEGESVL